MIDDVKSLMRDSSSISQALVEPPQQQQQQQQLTSELDETCRAIRAQIKDLFRNAKQLVTSLFAQTFVVTSEPLLTLGGDASDDSDLFTLRHHVDAVVDTCRLVAKCCEDPVVHGDIRAGVRALDGVTSRLMTYNNDEEEDFSGDDSEEAAAGKRDEWVTVFDDLFASCLQCLDLKTLVAFVLKELIK